MKSGFKRTNISNKYQPKVTIQSLSQYLDYLIDPGFQGLNSLFVLSFDNNNKGWRSYKKCFLPTVEIKDYNVIDGQNFFQKLSDNMQ